MKTYRVLVREVHVQYVEIEADSAESAFDHVRDGDGEYICLEYSHTLPSDTWTIEDDNGRVIVEDCSLRPFPAEVE